MGRRGEGKIDGKGKRREEGKGREEEERMGRMRTEDRRGKDCKGSGIGGGMEESNGMGILERREEKEEGKNGREGR